VRTLLYLFLGLCVLHTAKANDILDEANGSGKAKLLASSPSSRFSSIWSAALEAVLGTEAVRDSAPVRQGAHAWITHPEDRPLPVSSPALAPSDSGAEALVVSVSASDSVGGALSQGRRLSSSPDPSPDPSPSPSMPFMDPSTILMEATFAVEGVNPAADGQLAIQTVIADGAGNTYSVQDVFLMAMPRTNIIADLYVHIRVADQFEGNQLIATLSRGIMTSPATLQTAFQTQTLLSNLIVNSAGIVSYQTSNPRLPLSFLTEGRLSNRTGHRTLL
jgi:hypothetical protein